MSDHFEFEKLMKSLEVKADPVAKEKARETFLNQAEAVAAPAKNQGTVKERRKNRKRSILSFAAGMAAMLILFVGIYAAFTPAFLTGTIAGQETVVRYRLFPSETEVAAVGSSSVYTGELMILYTPGSAQTYREELTVCDGKTLSMDSYLPLLAVVSGRYGLDWQARTFCIPDYTKNQLTEGFYYCLVTEGLYPYGSDPGESISAAGIRYVAEDFSAGAKNGAYGLYLGELVLLKTANTETLPKELLPCAGQTLKTGDYPVLAALMGISGTSFTLPDLKEKSPVQGASYYLSAGGDSPYQTENP